MSDFATVYGLHRAPMVRAFGSYYTRRAAAPNTTAEHFSQTMAVRALASMGTDLRHGLYSLDGTGSYTGTLLNTAWGLSVIGQSAMLLVLIATVYARLPAARKARATTPTVNLVLAAVISCIPLAAAVSLQQHFTIAVRLLYLSVFLARCSLSILSHPCLTQLLTRITRVGRGHLCQIPHTRTVNWTLVLVTYSTCHQAYPTGFHLP